MELNVSLAPAVLVVLVAFCFGYSLIGHASRPLEGALLQRLMRFRYAASPCLAPRSRGEPLSILSLQARSKSTSYWVRPMLEPFFSLS